MSSRLVPLLVAVTLLAACGSVPETRYYTLARSQPMANAAAVSGKLSLGVRDFAAEGLYSRDNLLYRAGDYEIRPDYYRRWSQPPQKMLADAATDYVRSRGLFREVYRMPYMGQLDLVLEGGVVQFEETDSPSGAQARVDLEFSLSGFNSHERLWRTEVSASTPLAPQHSANDIVAGLQKALDSCLEQAMKQMSEYLNSASLTGK